MRILMLAQFYPPTIGGEEQHVRNLSIALTRRGHSVAVATLAHEGQPAFALDEGVRVYRLPATAQRAARVLYSTERTHAASLPDPETTLALRRIVRQERPQIVHAHNWLIHSFLPLKRGSGAKLLLTLHDYSLRCATKRLMYHDAPCSGPGFTKCLGCARDHYGTVTGVPTVLANWGMARVEHAEVDLFLPVSQAVADGNNLAGRGVPFTVIPNFVPDDVGVLRGEGAVEAYTTQLPQEDYLLFVGDLSRQKGLLVAFAAYAGLRDAPPLVCIGAPKPETPTELPTKVRVLQSWSHDAVMWAWSRSLIGLAPSVWPDPCPTVAMEAMAMGKPVIAARSGGLPDIVADEETGLVVPPDNVEALRGAMARLLANPEERARMGAAGKQRVAARFAASAVAARIEETYTGLLAGGHAAPQMATGDAVRD